MNEILTYLITTIVSLGIVYTGYVLALRSETLFRFNRFYLLSGLVASFVLPLISVLGWMPDIASAFFGKGQPADTVFFGVIVLPEVLVAPVQETGFTLSDVLGYAYLFVSVVFLLRFVVRLFGVWNLRRKAEAQACGAYSVCWVPDEVSPFSFFGTIFLSRAMEHEDQWKDIVRHESVHVREGHSYDILLLQWFKVFFWFNPFLYLVDRSLRESHEFQADAKALRVLGLMPKWEPGKQKGEVVRVQYTLPVRFKLK